MIPLQAVLFVMLVVAAVIYFRYFANHIVGRFIVLLVACALLAFILVPEAAHRVAWFLGVGRGVDLIFYLSHAFMLILVGLLYIKQRKQQLVITELVRKISIELSQRGSEGDRNPSDR